MRTRSTARFSGRGIAGVFSTPVLLLSVVSLAQETRDAVKPEHGGILAESRGYRFEVLFRDDGVWVYPRRKDGQAMAPSALSGTVTFYHPNSPRPWFSRPLQATAHGPASVLSVAIGLSSVPAQGAKAIVQVTGLPDARESSAMLSVPVVLNHAPRGSTPSAIMVTRATRSDQPAINAQRSCPVTGAPLGSMGTPIKVSRGGRNIFLCCGSCVKRVQANPDRYLGPTASNPARR